MHPRVANLHPFKGPYKCQLVAPWQPWTFSAGRLGRRTRERIEVSVGEGEERGRAVGAGLKSEIIAWWCEICCWGVGSGLGWRRWRVGGGQNCSRGWLHYLYLQWLSWSHCLSLLIPSPNPPCPPRSFLQVIFKPLLCLFLCPSLTPITDTLSAFEC